MAATDRNAAALGVSQKQLMESSGNAVARLVRETTEPGASIAVLAGRGNNGGDAFVAARFLEAYDISVSLLGRPASITTEISRENWDALQSVACNSRVVTDAATIDLSGSAGPGGPDVVVDGLLGTGVSGAPREPEASAIRAINETDATVVSVDVPSGVDADTGEAVGVAVDADRVVTFHDLKPGLADRGDVTVADIGIPEAAKLFVGPGDLHSLRHGNAPSGNRVYVIGGGPYAGAPALAARAALRTGADLSFVATPETVAPQVQGYTEDLIVQSYDGDQLEPETVSTLVDTAERYDDVVVIGPGLGDAEETIAAATEFLADFSGLAVVDADALPAVPAVDTDATFVCTPNRRELANMGGPDIERGDDIRGHAAEIESFAATLGHVVVAKATEDVITDGERTRVSKAGTSGMTVGGTGDTLAGAIAGLLGTHDPFEAACMAVYANGCAAELLDDERRGGLVATDLLETLPRALWGGDDE